jgi:hypothetical protein
MGILKDIEQAADDIAKAVEAAGAVIINDLDKIEKDITDGLAKIKGFLQTGFDEAEQKIISTLKADILQKYGAEITALHTLATKGIANADIDAIVSDIESVVKNADAGSATAILSNLVTSAMQEMYSEFTASFDTMSIGCDGEIDLLIGVSAGGSAGIEMSNAGDVGKARMLVDFLASDGVEEGGELGLCVGIWKGKPKGMTGGFLAVTLDATEGGGLGVVLYFSASLNPEFSGIVFNINAGEELEASIDCGFTAALEVPKGTIINMPVA